MMTRWKQMVVVDVWIRSGQKSTVAHRLIDAKRPFSETLASQAPIQFNRLLRSLSIRNR